jgi:hypothetical protein
MRRIPWWSWWILRDSFFSGSWNLWGSPGSGYGKFRPEYYFRLPCIFPAGSVWIPSGNGGNALEYTTDPGSSGGIRPTERSTWVWRKTWVGMISGNKITFLLVQISLHKSDIPWRNFLTSLLKWYSLFYCFLWLNQISFSIKKCR